MPEYVDGYVLPIPKKKLATYRKMARIAAKVWIEHGALDYRECVGEQLDLPFGLSFNKLVKVKRGESVMFSFVRFKSRKDRDRINAKVMQDPRIAESCDPKNMPFDVKRMSVGGFEVFVSG